MRREPRNRRRVAAVVAVVVVLGAASAGWAQGVSGTARGRLAEARRLFDDRNYEAAVPLLDAVVSALQGATPLDATVRAELAAALELRARARYGLADREGASADFRSLLAVVPGYSLPSEVNPRVVALFEEARRAVVGQIELALDPADAQVELDGAPFTPVAGPISMVAGPHTLSAWRQGYRSATVPFAVRAGATESVAVKLERVSATLRLMTIPPGVEVSEAGVVLGRTESGPLPSDLAGLPAALGVPAEAISQPLLLTDLTPGTHFLVFSKDCHVRTERQLDVRQLGDFRWDEPVRLARAVGSVLVDSFTPGASVRLDGQPRGAAPQTLAEVCEGEHLVELRAPFGRFQQRVRVRTGDELTVIGTVKPAVALLSVTGLPPGLQSGPDLRQEAERVLAPARSVVLLALATEEIEAALKAELLTPGWLALDRNGRPMTDAARGLTAHARREISTRLARRLDVQAVAEIRVIDVDPGPRLLISLLAAGSGQPDVFEVALEDGLSIGTALAFLNTAPPLFKRSVGVRVVDVIDVAGAVVTAVEPGSAAEAAGVTPGDAIVRVNATPVATAAQFAAVLEASRAGDTLSADVVAASGAVRRVSMTVGRAPRLISADDPTLPFNKLMLDYRATLAASPAPDEESVARLHLAVALMRLGNPLEALGELQRVQLPQGAGVSAGTVQYLMGLCHLALGQVAEAGRALRAASAVDGALLTEDGPPVRELAARRLAEIERRGGEEGASR